MHSHAGLAGTSGIVASHALHTGRARASPFFSRLDRGRSLVALVADGLLDYVLGVGKAAVGLAGPRFVVGIFGAATTTAAAPAAAAATILASRLAQILFTIAGSAVTAVAAKLQQRRRNSLPPPEPAAAVHTISLMSAPELEDPWLLALALAIIILALSRRRARRRMCGTRTSAAAPSPSRSTASLPSSTRPRRSRRSRRRPSRRAQYATGLATPAPLFMKATLAPTVQLTGGSSPLARRAPPSDGSSQSSELAPSMGRRS